MRLELVVVTLLAAGCGGGSSGGSGGSPGESPTEVTGQAGGTATHGGGGGQPTNHGGNPGATSTVVVPYGKSCDTLASQCAGESCCTSILVPGGEFPMGRGAPGSSDYYALNSPDDVEHPATLTSFYLDKYEVTVGRFGKFLEAYDAWRAQGHPLIGEGAARQAGSGWGESFTATGQELPQVGLDTRFGLASTLNPDGLGTWIIASDSQQDLPLNDINWFAAFAFCVWDGGRLPTEAEWEYAAAGGKENRLYPWGSAAPSRSLTNYNCLGQGDSTNLCTFTDILPVGSIPAGNGYFGHADLTGNVQEWVLDWYAPTYYGTLGNASPCTDCTNTSKATYRGIRGGSWNSDLDMQASHRSFFDPKDHSAGFGFRCARNP